MNWLYRFWRADVPVRSDSRLPDGVRIYAIGDIHGHDELLADLLDKVAEDMARRDQATTILVFLGDLIDRGPSSAAVLKRLRSLDWSGVKTVFLMGNHEEILLRIADGDNQVVVDWLRFGGDLCMLSYGVGLDELMRLSADAAGKLIRRSIPQEDIAFIRSFSDTFAAGDYLFVHAGIRPDVELARQSPDDLRWIRSPFLEWGEQHEYCVVHGHTISEDVEVKASRIGIDTGAYRYGKLTAIGLERDRRWFLQATR
jgi:serine/threonine protein phosphatase 1